MAAILIFSDFNSSIKGFKEYYEGRKDIGISDYSYANNCNGIERLAVQKDIYLIYEYYRKSTVSNKEGRSSLEKANVIDIIKDIISPKNNKNQIKGIIVFAYNNWDPLTLYSEFEIINDFFEKEKLQNAYTIETSHIFSRIPDKSIFLKQGTDIGTDEDLNDYGKLIGSIVNSLIVKNEKQISTNEELHYLHKNSLGFNQYISNLNLRYFLDGYKLATCSFIVSEINQYLIDWPYKEYYDPQNEYIVKGISRIFKKGFNPESDYHKGCNFYYFYLCLNKKSLKPVKLLGILSYINNKPEYIFNNGLWTCPETTNKNLFSDWCYILSTAVFFRTDLLHSIKWKTEGCNSCTKDCKSCSDCFKVGIFWFMHRIESIEDNDLHGLLTYTFCNTQETKLEINDIVDKGKFYYNTRRPLVEIKAKDTLFPYLFSTLNKHATQAAISQVMARNMRHNIGSHVLNNFTDSKALSNIGLHNKILRLKSYDGIQYFPSNNKEVLHACEGIIKYLTNIKDNYKNHAMDLKRIAEKLNHDLDLPKVLEEVQLNYPFGKELMPVNQIAYFNNYLNCRMDFLSELTFGIATMQTSRKVYSEVYKELDKVRLLLNYISGIADFTYSINFKYNDQDITDENDILVAFPSDLLGCQALYNIIENIIRNTAKHCHDKSGKTFFTINLKDILSFPEEINDNPNLLYCVEITDGIKINGNVGKLTDEEKTEYCIYGEKKQNEIDWGNIPRIDWLVHNQNIKLNQSVLGENKQLRSNSLGLLEMEASAAFLRQIELHEIESDDYQIFPDDLIYNKNSLKLNILKAYKAGDSQNGYSLGYRIFLKKPQGMLFVGDWILAEDEKEDSRIKMVWLNLGIWFRKESDFLSELNKGTNFNHQFVLLDGSAKDNRLQILLKDNHDMETLPLMTRLPLRIINLKDLENKFIELLKDLNYDILEKHIWEKWISIINPKMSEIIIGNGYDSEKCDHYQIILFDHTPSTSDWNDALNAANKATKPFWMEALNSNGQSKLPDYQSIPHYGFASYIAGIKSISNAGDDQNKKLIRWKIFEAYKRKVIVIDERIQNFSAQEHEKGLTEFQIYERSGVILPQRDVEITVNDQLKGKIDLDSRNYDSNLVALIEQYVEEKIQGADFLLIHYGILERMYKNIDSEKISRQLRHWSESIRVIVTSGRGKQSLNLPPEVCYINLSSITYAFMENRNKYSINYLLNQARR